MLFLIGGILAFALYGIYDVNSVSLKNRFLHGFFTAGTLLLGLCTVGCFVSEWGNCLMRRHTIFAIALIPGIISFLLMIYSLFFALPFDETYVRSTDKPMVCDRGMYALCRHPGVIWLSLMYLCLAVSWGTPLCWWVWALYSILDIAYVVLQDCWTFPKTFENYEMYKNTTPFLIPTGNSIRKAWQTRR